MTTLREAAQQALEAFRMCVPMDGKHAEAGAAFRNLRAALAQQDKPETCTWCQDGDSDSGVYATSCGHYFNLEDGTPEDNKMQWCCYCGKKLVHGIVACDNIKE